MKTRLTCLMVFSLFIGGGVGARAAYIQIIGDPRLAALAKRQFQGKMLVTPRRGLILDRNNDPLAVNTEVSSLAANPQKIQNKRLTASLMSKALGVNSQQLLEKFKGKQEFIWIKRHLKESQVDQFKKWGLTDSTGSLLPGLWLVKESYRAYPHGELAAPILGDVNIDNEGTEGIELWQNKKLEGKVTSVSAVRDALGRVAIYDPSEVRQARDGENIHLTIDSALQFSVEDALREAIDRTRSQAGSVIVMDSATGDLLAVANYPTFNPNDKGRGGKQENRKNRIITDGYEPGSTMKALLLATALSNGMKLTDRMHGEFGKFKLQGRTISEAESHEKFEMITLKKMLQVSSNVVSAKLALKLGAEKYIQGLRSFGLGERTGMGFPGEIGGWLPSTKQKWQPLTLANVGFGQGVMVTQLQMLRAYAAFANGGYLVTPRIMRSFTENAAVAPRRVISQEVAAQVTEALESVTQEGGTGGNAVVPGYRVAGKTGTAQTVDSATKRYSRSRYITSFIGYPVGVEPRFVIYTMLDEPKNGYYASTTAAPLFKEVLNAVVTRFGIPATEAIAPSLAKKDPTNSRKVEQPIIGDAKDEMRVSMAHPEPPVRLELVGANPEGHKVWKMPKLAGLTLREALTLLQGFDFQLQVKGNGLIQSQTPAEGANLNEGGEVHLTLVDEL